MIEKVREISNRRFSPSHSWVTKFWNKNNWKNWSTIRRTPQEMRESLDDEIQEFRQEVESYAHTHHIEKKNIFTEDEVGLWNDPVKHSTYVDPATKDNSVISYGQYHRDSGLAALSVEGEICSDFLEHKKELTRIRNGQKEIIQKGAK
jgi:hypothetical protein